MLKDCTRDNESVYITSGRVTILSELAEITTNDNKHHQHCKFREKNHHRSNPVSSYPDGMYSCETWTPGPEFVSSEA